MASVLPSAALVSQRRDGDKLTTAFPEIAIPREIYGKYKGVQP
jgi:hypothetical protein